MSPCDLLSVGETFEDLVFYDLPRLPLAGEERKTEAFERTVGGGALVTAVTAARLGLRCTVMSGLPPRAASLLGAERIDFIDLREDQEPFAVTAVLSTGAERALVTFEGVNAILGPRLRARLEDAEARHVHLALEPRDGASWCRTLARLRGRGTSVSGSFGWSEILPGDPAFLDLIGSLDYLFVNEAEARLFTGAPTLEEALDFLERRTRNAVVTRGARGALWLGDGERWESPAFPATVVETTGAGDAFAGGFLAGVLTGQAPESCLRLAHRAAALSTRAPGGIAGLPRAGEIS